MAKATQEKLNRVLEFIKSYISEHNYPPTVREICASAKVSSSASAQYYLNKLEEMGKIKRGVAKNRSIELIDKSPLVSDNVSTIPLIGTVAAGVPIFATENIQDNFSFSKNMLNGDSDQLFALKIKGDSMINAGILNGDTVIIKKQPTAQNGEIAVALIEDSATVKRFYKEDGKIRLQPENDFMEPIIVEDCKILGIVVGLLRKF